VPHIQCDIRKLVFVMVSVMGWAPLHAQNFEVVNASLLLQGCSAYERTSRGSGDFSGSPKDVADATGCQGWIIGVFHTLVKANLAKLCWSQDTVVNFDQMVRILLAYLEKHPQRLNEDSVTLAREAFQQAFPCPRTDVAFYQTRLATLGYDPGPIDGYLGERTRAAIRAFQRARGLPVTGKLSPEIETAIREDMWDSNYRSTIGKRNKNNKH
jgi:hypothetical protein